MNAVLRLLALVAMLLMPFGMASAPAEVAGHHGAMASMPMNPCPDEQSNQDGNGSVSECAMPCSASLPAAELPPVASPSDPRLPVQVAVEHALSGIELEIATPPPKRS